MQTAIAPPGVDESDGTSDQMASSLSGTGAVVKNMPRYFTLSSDLLEPFEIGALLLTILAFPGESEEEAMRKAAEALCSDTLRVTVAASPDQADRLQAEYPHYLAIDKAECRRLLRTLRRRLRDRMVAARMSLAYFQEGISKKPAKLPASMARLSINQLSELVLGQSGQSDSENVERRQWRESLPVIHLAAAMQVLPRERAHNEANFGYLLDSMPLHDAVIERAQMHEEIVLSDPRFGRNRDRLIRIRGGTKKL